MFSLDANTGRTTKYQFNVNGQSDTGSLMWNANGSLGQLAIIDALNSADSQNCTYSHDDLSRIATANCGSMSQTFSYDAFGNISASGSFSFGPTYNSSTNRFASIPGATVSYDNDGNVLSDGSHTYTWDAYGHALTADGIGLTYDAFGSMVEQNHSGAYTQIVYSPTGGKMAIMNGQSLSFGYFPLPSGLAEYHPNGVLYYRHADWLGTTRLVSSTTRTMYSDTAYAPFGETYAQGGSLDWSFTGMNQDTASGLFDFPAREYSIQGRWPSPDPAGLGAVNPANPQSWNRYAYVLNNPLALIDPLGLICNGATSTAVGGDPLANGTGIFTAEDCAASGGTWIEPIYTQITVTADPPPGDYAGPDLNGLLNNSSGGGSSILQKIKTAVCKALPSGGVVSVGGNIGTPGGLQGSMDIVTNYNTGQVSIFRSGGGFGGFNGEASGSLSSGQIWGLSNNNSNFTGPFTSLSASYKFAGISVASASGGYRHPLTVSTPTVVSAGVGYSAFGFGSATVAVTTSSPTGQSGNFISGTAASSTLSNYVFYYLRRPCN